MAAVYDDYGPDRVGFFFGLTGPRLAALTLAVIPVFVAVNQQRWVLAAELAALAAVVTLLVVVPVRGRSATGWLFASLSFAVGRAFGWTSWRSRAAKGKAEALENADLPGVMTGIEVHDGAPKGPANGPPTWAKASAAGSRSGNAPATAPTSPAPTASTRSSPPATPSLAGVGMEETNHGRNRRLTW